jgi:uncharacterized membrane-anchored protein YhcB (DUF1043 family)
MIEIISLIVITTAVIIGILAVKTQTEKVRKQMIDEMEDDD